jgi:hypothetical protein
MVKFQCGTGLQEYSQDGGYQKSETNGFTGLKSEANFVYDDVHQSTKVFYTFSNSGSLNMNIT